MTAATAAWVAFGCWMFAGVVGVAGWSVGCWLHERRQRRARVVALIERHRQDSTASAIRHFEACSKQYAREIRH